MTELLLFANLVLLLILIGVLKVRIQRKNGKIVMIGLFFNDDNYFKWSFTREKTTEAGKPEI